LAPRIARTELPSARARDGQANPGLRNGQSARLLLLASSRKLTPASHARASAQFLRRHLPGNALAQSTDRIPTKVSFLPDVRLPPLDFGFEAGLKGSINSHNGLGRSVAATSPLKCDLRRNAPPSFGMAVFLEEATSLPEFLAAAGFVLPTYPYTRSECATCFLLPSENVRPSTYCDGLLLQLRHVGSGSHDDLIQLTSSHSSS
jgi:hypothetical protein